MVAQGLRRLAVLAPLLLLGAAGPPEGAVIDPAPGDFPRQELRSEIAGGRQSFLVALGNTAFSSPLLYGAAARQAGLSCNACHVNGHVNRAFFIPGHSARPGGLDPTGPLFNPDAEDGVANHVDIPSLRGIRQLGPYGRDGRIGSLREFARHVIVTEFGGPEPAPLILDALVAYMNEFEFLANPRITPEGRLAAGATEAERRGEAMFRDRRGRAGLACGDCHLPGTAFTDARPHDVGTGGRFRTPTLLNAADSAPYGHDGRWADFAASVAAHDAALGLGLTARDRADVVAFLDAVAAVEDAGQPATFRAEMAELATYVGLLDETLRRRDARLTRFVVDTVCAEMARVARAFPRGDADRQAGRPDRTKALALDYAALEGGLQRVAALAEAAEGAAEGAEAAQGAAQGAEAGQTAAQGAEALAALDAYHDLAERMVANYPRMRAPR